MQVGRTELCLQQRRKSTAKRKVVASFLLPRTFAWCAILKDGESYGSEGMILWFLDSEWFTFLLDLGRLSSVWLGKEVATQNLFTKGMM